MSLHNRPKVNANKSWILQHFDSISYESDSDNDAEVVESVLFRSCVSNRGYPLSAVASHSKAHQWEQYHMTSAEFHQFVSVFYCFDDGREVLNKPQFERLCLFLNYAHSSRESDFIFNEMDTRKRGVIDLHDFCTWLSCNSPGTKESYGLERYEYHKVLLQFRSCDPMCCGSISFDQFRQLCMITRITSSRDQENYLLRILLQRGCVSGVSLREFLALYRDIRERRNRNESFFPPLQLNQRTIRYYHTPHHGTGLNKNSSLSSSPTPGAVMHHGVGIGVQNPRRSTGSTPHYEPDVNAALMVMRTPAPPVPANAEEKLTRPPGGIHTDAEGQGKQKVKKKKKRKKSCLIQ